MFQMPKVNHKLVKSFNKQTLKMNGFPWEKLIKYMIRIKTVLAASPTLGPAFFKSSFHSQEKSARYPEMISSGSRSKNSA